MFWRSNTFSGYCSTFRISQLFRQGFSFAIFLNFAITPFGNFIASAVRRFRTSHLNLPEFDANNVARFWHMCLTEIPGVSGETGRQPIRETRLIGIPRRVKPRVSAQETSRRRGATRHVRYRRRSSPVLLLISKEDSPEWPRLRDFALDHPTT